MSERFSTSVDKLVFFRAFAVWLVIIFAESIHGTLRVLFLEPYFGDFRARQIAVFSGAFIILTITFLFSRFINTKNQFQLFLTGLFWLILTLLFEILLGRFVMNLSWERIISDYNVARGGLLPLGLLVLLLAPLIASYFRRFLLLK